MAKIEGIRIQNFKTLKDVTLGKLWNNQSPALSPMTVVIGKNGVGKSTLFDVFGFLADCMKIGVEEACDKGRGGFTKLRSQEQSGPIEFEIYYREDEQSRPITYELSIDLDNSGRPFVSRERLRQRRRKQTKGRPFSFLILEAGKGYVWKGDAAGHKEEGTNKDIDLDSIADNKEESTEREFIDFVDDIRKPAIATLGVLKQHPRISSFRRFIEGWYLSYFTPDAARCLPLAGPQKHLNIHGDNLANVVQFMQRENPECFESILKRIAERIPGIKTISTEKTKDDRLLIQFNNEGFKEPFYAQQMSDGTLKVFAYLLLLEDLAPPPFLCIEEPENGLYHKLLETLAQEFRKHAMGPKEGTQVFITTHQPYFVDAFNPNEVWILKKDSSGFSEIKRASEINYIQNMVDEGQPLGALWYSDHLEA